MILQAGTFTQSKIENTHILKCRNEMIKITSITKLGIE